MPITPAQRAVADGRQLAAAHDPAPQVRLIAGPGTGKSGTIIKRVVHLLSTGVDPSKVYVISFTRAACQELRERVQNACAGTPFAAAPGNLRISTMHSLALRIAKRGRLLTVGAHEPRLLDDWEQGNVYDRELATSVGCNPTRAAEIRLAHDAQWQTLNPTAIAQAAVTPREQMQFNAFHASRTNLYCCLLPGEVVFRCVEAIQNGQLQPAHLPNIEHLIVDEYQDLNACDQEFVRRLCTMGAVLFIAGDDDQSIYSFRHANPDGIVRFPQTYPASNTHVLTDCFRCTPAVVAPALRLIGHNPNRVAKTLVPLYGGATPPVNGSLFVWSFPTADDEAKAIAQSCQALIAGGFAGREDDIVVLLSNRRVQLDLIARELGNLGLPYAPPTARGLTDADGVRAAYCLLRMTADRLDNAPDYPAHRALLGLLSGVGPGTAKVVADACIANNQNFHDLFYAPVLPAWLIRRASTAVTRIRSCATATSPWTLADTLAARSNDMASVLATHVFASGANAAGALAEWSTLSSALPPQMTLSELLDLLSADTEAEQQAVLDLVNQRLAAAQPQVGGAGALPGPPPPIQRKIRILTMHGAKGLSGKVVFIPSAEQEIMPSRRALAATGLLIEARRLFYVSLTRAMAACVVTHAAAHTGATAFQLAQQPRVWMTRSQFLNEMGVPSTNRVGGLTPAEVATVINDVANL